MVDQILPKDRLGDRQLTGTVDTLHMAETKLRLAVGTPIKIRHLENDNDWEYALITAYKGKKVLAVF